MDFSQALLSCKQGCKIYRNGWNGANQYVVFKPGYESVSCNKAHAEAHNIDIGTPVKISPYLEIKLVSGETCPWVPSVGDLMGEDWETTKLN